MNGESTELLNALKAELNHLKDLMSERWDTHAQRSIEFKEGIQQHIDKKISELPCKVHIERMSNIKTTLAVHWGMFIIIVGSIVGGFFWMLRK